MSEITAGASGFMSALGDRMDQLWEVVGGVSVRTKILGIVLASVFILGAGVTVQVRLAVRQELIHGLQEQGISIARDVAARSVDLLLVRDLFAVHELLEETLTNNEDAIYAFVVDPHGEIVAHTFGDLFPTTLVSANVVGPDERHQLTKLGTNDGIVWDVAVPIFNGQAGVVRIGLSESAARKALDGITRQLLLTTILVSMAGVVAAIFLTWLITRPVVALESVTRQVARGDLSMRAPHWADDEIGRLSDSFNAMVQDLDASKAENDAYNAKLIRRNRELAALNIVAQTVSQQQELHLMLSSALECVLELVGMQAGWISLLDTNGYEPKLACSIGLPVEIARAEAEQGFLDCQCRQAVEGKTTLLITPLQESCPIYRLQLRNKQIVRGHVAVPLVAKSRVLGMLNIACSEQKCFLTEDLHLLSAIGQQLGVAVENAQLWQEIRQKEEVRGQLLEKIITAQEEERIRIARELHDDTSQALTSLKVGLRVLDGLKSPDEIQQHVTGMRQIVTETLDAVHDLALELRPSVLDDLGLVAAVQRYVVDYQRRYNIRVDLRTAGFRGERLSPSVETAIYRIVQESLTNVARHAGAELASVLLEKTNHDVRTIVEDDGCGFDVGSAQVERKLGLFGMAERATLIGGHLHIESAPKEGTTILVQIPLAKMPASDRANVSLAEDQV